MKRLVSLFAALAALSTMAAGAQSTPKEVNVTVYNNNRGVVRELRQIDIPKGTSELQIADVPRDLIPATVKIDFSGKVLEQNFRFDIANLSSILSRYIDKEITLIGTQTYTGKLISITEANSYKPISVVLQMADGKLTLVPYADKYEISLASMPEGFVTRPTLFWSLEAEKGGRQDVELSYQTENMDWNAEYILVLNEDDSRAKLDSWVSLTNNSGATYRDARLKLVAGNVRTVYRERQDKRNIYPVECYSAVAVRRNFREESLFEYHVYELERKTTLADRETKQIALFSSDGIAIAKSYKFNCPDQPVEGANPSTVIEFENSKANHLGSPMPEGNFQVMKVSGRGKELVGESKVAHTPKDEKIKLEVGRVFDVSVDNVVVSDVMVGESLNEKEFEIKIRNHKNETVKVELMKIAEGAQEVLNCSEKWEKENAYSVKIPVSVGANSEKTVKLKVRTQATTEAVEYEK